MQAGPMPAPKLFSLRREVVGGGGRSKRGVRVALSWLRLSRPASGSGMGSDVPNGALNIHFHSHSRTHSLSPLFLCHCLISALRLLRLLDCSLPLTLSLSIFYFFNGCLLRLLTLVIISFSLFSDAQFFLSLSFNLTSTFLATALLPFFNDFVLYPLFFSPIASSET